MDASRKRLRFMLLLGTMLLGLNTLAVVTGNADILYGSIARQSESDCDAGGSI
ncbi:MAG: hypothetical protein ACR2O5_07820 [Thiogranum sp.]